MVWKTRVPSNTLPVSRKERGKVLIVNSPSDVQKSVTSSILVWAQETLQIPNLSKLIQLTCSLVPGTVICKVFFMWESILIGVCRLSPVGGGSRLLTPWNRDAPCVAPLSDCLPLDAEEESPRRHNKLIAYCAAAARSSSAHFVSAREFVTRSECRLDEFAGLWGRTGASPSSTWWVTSKAKRRV